MIETTLEGRFPSSISAKYLGEALPAQMCGHASFQHIGPAIKTTVRAIGVQHFAVYAEPEGKMVAEFKSENGPKAHDLAVAKAEERGLPWMVSGGSDVFEPATGKRWSYHVTPLSESEA